MRNIFIVLSMVCLLCCNRTPSKLINQLTLDDINTTWVLDDERSKTAVPMVDLYFSEPVDVAQLKSKLKIQVEGQPIQYDIQTLSNNNQVTLKLSGISPQDKDLETGFTIEKGLRSVSENKSEAAEIKLVSSIPSPFNLVINDISPEHNGLSGLVYVRTSQQLIMDDISTLIKIEPAVKFTVEKTDNGFILKSNDFDAEKNYLLKIAKGLKGLLGGTLQESYDRNIAFGELEPTIRFATSKSVFLSAKGNRTLDINIVNVEKAKIIISKIYESNLLSAQRYGYYPREKYQDDDYYYSDYGSNELTTGDIIYEQEIDTRGLPEVGNSKLLKFNFEDKLSEFKGIYHIKIRSLKDSWISDSRFIAMSDLGLIAKEGSDKLFVFVNSIKSAEPVVGVNVVAYGTNNQVLGMAATNFEGVAEIAYTRKEFAGFKPAMVVAKTETDFNYLPFSSTKVNTSRFETGGKRSNSTGLDAYVYAERDIYRPGERVNFAAIIRDRQWKAPGEIPVIVKFLMPNGKELKTFRKSLNTEGSLEGSVDINNAAITGSYTLELYTSNEILLASKYFSIEEFVPDRIKVAAMLNKTSFSPGEKAQLTVNAVNFFGPPASGRNYETEIQIRSKYFSPAKYNKYNFSLQNAGLSFDKVVRQGKTDAAGNALEVYEVPALYKNNGVLQANFYSTVFDETGRPVGRAVSADIYTQDVFMGIENDDNWYYPLNQSAKFSLIAVDKDGKAVSGKAVVKMIKREYKTIVSKAGSYFRYESQQEDKVLAEQTISVNGESSLYIFTPRSPGSYELRVAIPGASGYVSKRFYSYGSWGGENSSFEVNTEGNIDIAPDKSGYAIGETAKILFKTPFNGKMLVTVETDKLLYHQYVNVDKRNASIDVKIKEEFLPNVFVTATLIKPHGISDIPLTVAHGFQGMKVEEKKRINKVEILAQKNTRSKTKQEVTVKATPGSLVTLAAVDNGVLQVSDFKTPDPHQFFYGPRALEVTGYNIYPFLFPEVRSRQSSTGGDMGMDKRVNPMPAKRVQIVSYWSGISKADGSGQAKFSFDIPAFSGQVRLMAVAYKGNTFGSADANMTVADPLVLSTSLPRFMSPGDSVAVPVTISNTTNKNAAVTALLKTSGPLKVKAENSQTLNIAANSEGRVVFNILADVKVDTGRVTVEVNGLGEKFSDEISIGVRPASPLQKITGSGIIDGGAAQKINIDVSDFMSGSADYQLVVSRNPLLDMAAQLKYLIQYPYGCTEQAISAAFPQLYFADLSQQLSANSNLLVANENVNEAIRKIKLRQLYNGAVTLWDGEGKEHWWSSAYAAHFLLEAEKAGFEVDKNVLNGLLNYINNKLRNRQTISYYYNRDQNKKIAPKEVAYSLYVLATASRPNIPAMNYYKANLQLLSLDSKYLLSAAYAIAGDSKRFAEILPGSFSGEESVPQTGGSFYSPIRDEAIALHSLIEVDPDNSQVPVMARHISQQLKQRNWYSTQECAFSFLALGKLARTAGKSTVTAELKVNGKTTGKFDGKDIKLSAKNLNGHVVDITTKGNGKLYYFWQSEGISTSGQYKEEDNYIKVRRQFYDRYGRKIDNNIFKQNDLIIVQISLEKIYSGAVENIAVTDILPAGFEIENPRTKEIPGMDWIKDAAYPLSLDVRDDRINLFVNLYANKQNYYYAVRAVSLGEYVMGPVGADAMYNGEYHSYHGAGKVVVEP